MLPELDDVPLFEQCALTLAKAQLVQVTDFEELKEIG
jgi:hypothetical protein